MKNTTAFVVGSFCSDPHAPYFDYGISAEDCFNATGLQTPDFRAENSQLCGSFAGPSSTCQESSRRIEVWLALFPGFHRRFKWRAQPYLYPPRSADFRRRSKAIRPPGVFESRSTRNDNQMTNERRPPLRSTRQAIRSLC